MFPEKKHVPRIEFCLAFRNIFFGDAKKHHPSQIHPYHQTNPVLCPPPTWCFQSRDPLSVGVGFQGHDVLNGLSIHNPEAMKVGKPVQAGIFLNFWESELDLFDPNSPGGKKDKHKS